MPGNAGQEDDQDDPEIDDGADEYEKGSVIDCDAGEYPNELPERGLTNRDVHLAKRTSVGFDPHR